MKSFLLNGKKYDYIDFKDLKSWMLPPRKKYKKTNYLDIGSGFDIETTNFEMDGRHYATMYCWQWSFDELTVIGRTWDEFKAMLEMIQLHFHPDKENKLLVFIHNLSFEFSFIRKYMNIGKVLAKTKREVITFTSDFIEFRDSLILTRFGLERMAKNYKLGIEKLKGDLDYNLVRISTPEYQTPLELNEIAYCINDVQILQRFFHKYIKQEFLRNGWKIPLTQTAIPRMETKRKLKKQGYKYNRDYRDMIMRCYPDEKFYYLLRRFAFRGGYVHGNNTAINNLFTEDYDDMAGFDRKSSYPASIFHEKMPMQYFDQPVEWFYNRFNEPEEYWKDFGFVGAFKFKNIRAKYPHCIESKHKLVDWDEASTIFDNGRLLRSASIYVVLTEYDFLNYKDFYEWEDMECVWIKSSRKEWLPDFIIQTVYSYFIQKETLPKDSLEYARAKEKLNGIFGMMATGLPDSEYIMYDGNLWLNTDEELPEEVRQEKKPFEKVVKNCFLLCQWSITIAAASRRELLKLFRIAPYDSLYGDTDSDKIRNYKKYLPAIEEYNKIQEDLNREAASRWNLEFKYIKDLGKFMKEDEYKRFKVLGCKRYLYETKPIPEKHIPSEIHAVVAGMERGSFLNWCEKFGKDPFDEFKDSLYLKPEFSNKITSSYIDEAFEFELTDYKGHKGIIHEECCCGLYAIPFSMNVDPDFIALVTLLKKKEERKKEIYKDVL